ncbi:MAG: hypothetical protein OXK73_03325 [Rhodospirillaceae bacterium]|nr:hypothetical protein [Rhodospirillaceae bacterium]
MLQDFSFIEVHGIRSLILIALIHSMVIATFYCGGRGIAGSGVPPCGTWLFMTGDRL